MNKKEQERINRIEKHNLEGRPVPPELVKVEVHLKEKYTDSSRKYRRESIAYFENVIEPYIVNIANSIKMYDLKICIIFRIDTFPAGTDHLSVFALLQDSKGITLGTLVYRDVERNGIYASTNFTRYSINNKNMSEPDNIFLSLTNKDIIKNLSQVESNALFDKLINITLTYYRFLEFIDIFITDELCIEIGKNIVIFCMAHTLPLKKFHLDIETFNEIEIVKMFIHFGHIKNQFREEDLIPENIEEITNIIKMTIY